MENQNETMIIVSLASQNPDRQRELQDDVSEMSSLRAMRMHFPRDDDSAIEAMREAEILFTWRLTEEMYHAAKRLRWIHLSGAGADRILFPALRDSNVALTNSRGMHGPFIAEWTAAALFHIAQRFNEASGWRIDREWSSHKHAITANRFLLAGKRALIVGYGSIGQAIAEKLRGVGVTCEGVASTNRTAMIPIHVIDELQVIIGRFDMVVVALPLTERTQNLFDEYLFSRMKPGAILVNIARGKLVDESALIEALRHGPLAYAALDVFAQEPLPQNSPLFDLPNLFMTPHVSGNYPDYSRVAIQIFLANLRRYLNCEPLENVVDKVRGY